MMGFPGPMFPPMPPSGSGGSCTKWPLYLIVLLAILTNLFIIWFAGLIPESVVAIVGDWARGPKKAPTTTPPATT